jgi:hypothetical protein
MNGRETWLAQFRVPPKRVTVVIGFLLVLWASAGIAADSKGETW